MTDYKYYAESDRFDRKFLIELAWLLATSAVLFALMGYLFFIFFLCVDTTAAGNLVR